MARTVTLDQLANEIVNAVREYTQDVTTGIEKTVDSTADKVLKEVKILAPRRIPDYYKTFTKTNKSLPGNRRYVVWNKKHYRRVHLLEYGHAKVNGGRVRAFPHLGPAHDKYADEMVDKIRRVIRDGG